MTRFRRYLTPAVLVLTAAFALTSCAKTIDESSVEKEIKRLFAENYPDSPLKTVKCPSGEDAKKGHTFKCSITTDSGLKGQVEVKLTDDNGKFTLSVTKAPS
ncbi:MAG TPA: DUF4333 domain-containing protein [Marmoricola sp.]|jgi:hypothetical protein|nr:DUF4333 domain-containing protein [Marmoricola sp.]